MAPIEDSVDLLRRDFTLLGNTNANLVIEVSKMRDELRDLRHEFDKHKALREQRDEQVDKRLDNISSLGKWLLFTVIGGFVTGAITFVLKGGLGAAFN